MKKSILSKLAAIIIAILTVAALMAGCGDTGAPVPENSGQTEVSESHTSAQETYEPPESSAEPASPAASSESPEIPASPEPSENPAGLPENPAAPSETPGNGTLAMPSDAPNNIAAPDGSSTPIQTPATARIVAIDPGHQRQGNYSQEAIGPGSGETKAKVTSGTRGVAT